MEPVKYREMLVSAAGQIQQRTGLIGKRVFLTTWPVMTFVVLQYVAASVFFDSIPLEVKYGFLTLWGVFAGIYGIFMGLVFRIEKVIWIDSYFDGRNLTPEQSWRIARKLFVPNLKLFGAILVRYFIPVIVSVICGLMLIFLPFWNHLALNGSDAHAIYSMIGIFLVAIMPLIYGYFLSVKMRFVSFLFLDTYGSGLSWSNFFDELKKLNSVATSQSVVKTVAADFGAASIRGLTSSLIITIQNSVTQVGPMGRAAGRVAGVYADGVSSSMVELGRDAAVYLLYRYAREDLYKKPQEVNEALYNLAR